MISISIRKINKELLHSGFVFFVIWSSCSIILLLPKEYIKSLYLDKFLTDYGWIIGILFIVSSVILLELIIRSICSLLKQNK